METKRHRCWMFTLYNKLDNSCLNKFSYVVGQYELCPSTQKQHFQGYLECQNGMSLKRVKDLLGDQTAHLEPRKGSQKQAITYVTKLETRDESMPSICHGIKKNQGERNDLKRALDLLNEGTPINDIIDEMPGMLRLDKHLERYKQRAIAPRNFATEVHVRVGETGTGKTRYVHETEKDLWVMSEPTSTQWFDGYEGQEAVLIDDFKGTIRYNFLLQLTDRYPMRVNTKGGFVHWRPKRIYITSNYEPIEWYQQNIEHLERRITTYTQVDGNTIRPPA